MEILALVGSPRRLGNSELMAKEISRCVSEPHRLKLVRLPEMDIGPCWACYTCLFDERTCPQGDDFSRILEALVTADALILAVPTYMLAANASLKQFLDRGLSLVTHIEQLWDKPAVAVAIAGIPGMEGYTKLCLDSALRLIGARPQASEVVYGALPGEVFMNETNRQMAKKLAEALLGPPPDWEDEPWRCPACGGDTFRFLGSDQVRCMTCSSPGDIQLKNDQVSISVDVPVEHFFLSLEGARRHLDWLRGMKQRFLEKKEELKSICLAYLHEGDWLEPRRNKDKAPTGS